MGTHRLYASFVHSARRGGSAGCCCPLPACQFKSVEPGRVAPHHRAAQLVGASAHGVPARSIAQQPTHLARNRPRCTRLSKAEPPLSWRLQAAEPADLTQIHTSRDAKAALEMRNLPSLGPRMPIPQLELESRSGGLTACPGHYNCLVLILRLLSGALCKIAFPAAPAAKVTRKTSSGSKGVISTSKPPRFSTFAQRASSARRENTIRFGGAGSLSVALRSSSQLPSAWSRSHRSTGTLLSRKSAKASQQPEASCRFQSPWERISRSRTRSAGTGLTARTAVAPSGDGIVSSDRWLTDSPGGRANGSWRKPPHYNSTLDREGMKSRTNRILHWANAQSCE